MCYFTNLLMRVARSALSNATKGKIFNVNFLETRQQIKYGRYKEIVLESP